MTFEKVIPRARSSSGDIKVSFIVNKSQFANIFLSFDILDKLKYNHDDKLCVYIDSENINRWMIEKAKKLDKGTFKLNPLRNKNNGFSRLQFKFTKVMLSKEERKIRRVNYQIENNRIILDVGIL